jgi:hypothetical protein
VNKYVPSIQINGVSSTVTDYQLLINTHTMSGALSVVPVRPNLPYQSTALTSRLVSFPDPTPESYWNTQRRTRYVSFLFSSTSSNTDGCMVVITQYTSLSTQSTFGKLSKLSIQLPFTFHTSYFIFHHDSMYVGHG